MFGLNGACLTDIGLKRDNNEDAFYASPSMGLWLVADGMGGHAAGEVASDIAIKSIVREVREGKRLSQAVRASHSDIRKAANSGVGASGMGATIVAMRNHALKFEICWVGDSRAYLHRVAANAANAEQAPSSLTQLTTDHSYVQMLYQSGAISKTEIARHPERNIITQCLGSHELDTVSVDKVVGEWTPNSCILLCSDGLSDVVPEEEINSILYRHSAPDIACQALIRAALDRGGKDNITVCVIKGPNTLQRICAHLKNKF